MDINTIFILAGITFFGYIVYRSLKPVVNPFIPQRTGLLVAQDTGKTHYNQSKTGDASLAIERVRRKAIQGHGRANKKKIKETHTQLGSTTGALETFMISSICPKPVCCPYDIILDGGDEQDEFCEYVGSGYLDAGNQNTESTNCKPVCPSSDLVLDGGDEQDEFCEYVGSGYLDAGNHKTEPKNCKGPVCPSSDIILDGGDEDDEFCEYVGSGYLDAGNHKTKVCGL